MVNVIKFQVLEHNVNGFVIRFLNALVNWSLSEDSWNKRNVNFNFLFIWVGNLENFNKFLFSITELVKNSISSWKNIVHNSLHIKLMQLVYTEFARLNLVNDGPI